MRGWRGRAVLVVAWGLSRGLHAGDNPLVALPDARDWLATNVVASLRLELSADAVQSLRSSPRQKVLATVREGETVYADVSLHLKGAIGSFRSIDQKPSWTLQFNQGHPGRRFHGLRKIHLNNSGEDPSYLHEQIGSELFRAAGVPAPRVTHALVALNARSLGLYVLKEAMTKDFLKRHFRRPDGALYDIGLGHDVDEPLERRSGGENNSDRSALAALARAALEPDPGGRWAKLQPVLDVDRFVTFMAMEILMGHRDGYSLARNNFRLYHDPESGRFVFLPAGMDQLFGKADFPWRPRMAGLVARAVLETPEGRRRYDDRFGELLTNVFRLELLTNRVAERIGLLAKFLPRQERRELTRAGSELVRRIVERHRFLERELATPPREPLNFANGWVRLQGWRPFDPPAAGRMDLATLPEGKATLYIGADRLTAASWRLLVQVPRGRYELEGWVKTSKVVAIPFGKHQGAALGVTPTPTASSPGLLGDASWTRLMASFAVTNEQTEVELRCELRASGGEVWFDRDSLRLRQKND